MSKFIDMAVLATIVFSGVMFASDHIGAVYIGCVISAILMMTQDIVERHEYYAKRAQFLQMRRQGRTNISL